MDPELQNSIICPITSQVYRTPVIISSGQTYEKNAIVRWFKNNDIDPVTNTPVATKTYVVNYSLLKIIDYYEEKQLLPSDRFRSEFNAQVYREQLNESEQAAKEYLETVDILYSGSILHTIIGEFSNNRENIEYVIQQGADINAATEKGVRPIHLVCEYRSMATLSRLLKYKPELCVVTDDGLTPLHGILKSEYHRIEKMNLLLPLLKEDTNWNTMMRNCAPFKCTVACPEDLELLQHIVGIAPIQTELNIDLTTKPSPSSVVTVSDDEE